MRPRQERFRNVTSRFNYGYACVLEKCSLIENSYLPPLHLGAGSVTELYEQNTSPGRGHDIPLGIALITHVCFLAVQTTLQEEDDRHSSPRRVCSRRGRQKYWVLALTSITSSEEAPSPNAPETIPKGCQKVIIPTPQMKPRHNSRPQWGRHEHCRAAKSAHLQEKEESEP